MRRIPLMVLAAFALAAMSGQIAFAAGHSKIAFLGYIDGYPRLFLVDADGSNRTPFDPPGVQAGPATWSPDGTKIVYGRNDPNDSAHSGMVIAAVDGSGIVRIGPGGGNPSWSPDGLRIVFNCGSRDICVVGADGNGLTTVLDGGVADLNVYPSWSPDGTQITYAHNVSFSSGLVLRQIYVMNADGSSPHNVSNSESWDDYPRWGPDGRIAFMTAREVVNGVGIYKVFVMDGDGSNQHAIASERMSEYYPAWSSDGSGIAFTSDRDAPGCDIDCKYELYTMTATGQNVTRLTFDANLVLFPAWHGDGEVVDTRPPTVQCSGGSTGWANANVTVACTASDPSGLANPADAAPGFQLSTSVPAGVEDSGAMTDSHQVCDLATPPNCTTVQRGPFMVDRKAPTISVTTPANNAAFVLAQPVNASYTCLDGGSGTASCTGPVSSGSPIDTASVGTKTFIVNASDQVGNQSPQASRSYTVSYAVTVVQAGGGLTVRLEDFNGVNRSSASIVLTLQSIDGSSVTGQTFSFKNNNVYKYTPPHRFGRGPHTVVFVATGDPVPHTVSFTN